MWDLLKAPASCRRYFTDNLFLVSEFGDGGIFTAKLAVRIASQR
jgi:hypothetical protein